MMHKLMTHMASPGLSLTRLHSPDAKVGAKQYTNAEFLYGVLFALIVATCVSGIIAAYLAVSSLQ